MDKLPASYYSLHADELKLLQFLLYHLRYKKDRKIQKGKMNKVEISKSKEKVRFD